MTLGKWLPLLWMLYCRKYLSLIVGFRFLVLMRLCLEAKLDLLDGGGSGARTLLPLFHDRLLAADCRRGANVLIGAPE